MSQLKAKCINPTKTISKDKIYNIEPVKKNKSNNSYNGRYTTKWISCSLKECTSYKLIDNVDIIRFISKKRFKLIT